MGLEIGATDATAVYVGTTPAAAVYLGSVRVWPTAVPIAYDTVGSAYASGNTASPTWSHTSTAGDYIIVDMTTSANATATSCTYGGVTMTLLATVSLNNNAGNGKLFRWGLANALGGARTVAPRVSAGGFVTANSTSYQNVLNAPVTTTNFGSGATMSKAETCSPDQMIVGAFGAFNGGGETAPTSINGGTSRYVGVNLNTALAVITATTSSTLSASTGIGSQAWAGVTTVLS